MINRPRLSTGADGGGDRLRWIGADLVPGRFFEGPDVVRRIAPFVAAGVLPFGLVPFTPASFADAQVIVAAAMVPPIIALALLAPWRRLPAWTQAILPLAYFVIVALLRDAAGGPPNPFDPLVVIPVAWFALYGTRPQLLLSILGMSVTLALPAVLIGAPTYDAEQYGRAAIALLLAGLLGPTVQLLISALREQISERKRSEAALMEAEERFRRAFEDNRVGMAITSTEGKFMRVNGALAEITGYPMRELVGKRFAEITHPDDVSADLEALREVTAGKRYGYRTEKRYLHANGHQVWIALNVSPIHDENGDVIHMISQMEDITDRKETEARLTHQALHDPLTGLPNRVLFADRVRVASARRDTGSYAVIYLDLDTFKPINDTLGHAAGDQVLVEVSRRLEGVLREGDTLARLGGDEFAILCEGVDEAEARLVAERVIEAFSSPFEVDEREVEQAVSIGVAVHPRTGNTVDPEVILGDADRAMYRAKAAGKSRYALFEGWMGDDAAEPGGLERELRSAIANGELRVHYQPEIDLATGAVTGAEALARWEHPRRGLLEPAQFLVVAESSGLITEIDDFVLRQACRQAARWRETIDPAEEFTVSVNLSDRQLGDTDLPAKIAQAIADSHLPGSSLCLELAERAVLDRRGDALAAIPDIESLGVRLLIDDFGVAISSFSTIKRLPRLSAIKIDSSFIAGLGRSREDSAAVAAIIGLAHGLRLTATAEGVETADQTAELRKLSCDRAQGFYFARPQSPDAFGELLDSARYGELLA